MDMDFGIIGPLVRPELPRIRFLSVRSRLCSTLPSDPASRRRPGAQLHPSPPSGWVEDFHLQAAEHARHTKKGTARRAPTSLAYGFGSGGGGLGFFVSGKGTYKKALCPLPQTSSSFKLIIVHLHGAEAAAHGALVFFGLGEVPVAPGFGGVDGELDLGVPVQGPASLGHF